ncbi:MAG: hypothetical protein ACM3ZT_05695 [Bacillota bacterium]
MNIRFTSLLPLLAASLLSGCVTEQSFNITRVNWPPAPQDEVDVRPTLTQLVKDHPSLKVVLRVPNVTSNVTQAQTAQTGGSEASLNGAYDIIEKRLFKAGFVVRDRALLSSLIDKEGISSYQEIQKRVDTDLIIDVSSLKFNDPQDWLITDSYQTDTGQTNGAKVGEAVASVEAKFIIVSTGEVGGIVTLHVPICQSINCTFSYYNMSDDLNGIYNTTFKANSADQGYLNIQDQNTGANVYLWGGGSGNGGLNHAADLIAQKIVEAL